MDSIIVSDLHIGSRFFLQKQFSRFLKNIPENCRLILNGDILDNPYTRLEATHQEIIGLIEQVSYRQNVIWVRGNHDNGYLPKGLGKIEFKNSHNIGRRLFIVHGDAFDEVMPRTRLFMKGFSIMHNLRVKLGARPVHVAQYAKNWSYFYNILRKNIMSNAMKCALENGYDAVTCGHTHYPEDILLNGVRYINTGAWTEFPSTYLLVTDDEIILKKVEDL